VSSFLKRQMSVAVLGGVFLLPQLALASEPEIPSEGEGTEDGPSADEREVEGDAVSSPDPDSKDPKSIENDETWTQPPFESDDEEWDEDFPGARWTGLGAFVGVVHRPSGDDDIRYKPGVAYGGYLRPEITTWLDARIFYRQESIPVELSEGALDYGGESHNLDFHQPNLDVVSAGVRLEPVWVLHPRIRLRGIAGWSWLGFRAEMPEAPGYNEPEDGERGIGGVRSAVETNFIFGAGMSLDLVKNWLDLSVDTTYSITASQTGSAYEPQQIVVDGQITHIAPLPKLQNSTDLIFSIGVIL
jgi:hypothetical protein